MFVVMTQKEFEDYRNRRIEELEDSIQRLKLERSALKKMLKYAPPKESGCKYNAEALKREIDYTESSIDYYENELNKPLSYGCGIEIVIKEEE